MDSRNSNVTLVFNVCLFRVSFLSFLPSVNLEVLHKVEHRTRAVHREHFSTAFVLRFVHRHGRARLPDPPPLCALPVTTK